MAQKTDLTVVKNCDYCPSTLPTVRIKSGVGLTSTVCRACALDILDAIENPGEYPAVIEQRDADLAAIREETE